MTNAQETQIYRSLQILYPQAYETAFQSIRDLLERWSAKSFPQYPWVSEKDILMIAYGDSFLSAGKPPLAVLKECMDAEFRDSINLIHLLPMFPYSSDDGFSVIDFREINPELGTWEDINALKSSYGLMFDAVINHASRQGHYFAEFAAGNEAYRDFFIAADPAADYSSVIRPRTLPLLTEVATSEGKQFLWTTFSDDQIDFNYKNPKTLLEMLDVLLLYAQQGARFIRFDAVGFVWKELGTGCMHLPEAHHLVKLMRAAVQSLAPGCSIITETNVPHADNISYFGNGHDEAGMVYQFPLPPLVLFSFLTGNAEHLTDWAASLESTSQDTAYFNFLASHDGIGIRPVENILSKEERDFMVTETLRRGGEVSYRVMPDNRQTPYELNINYLDAVAGDEKNDALRAQKFMASQCILLSMMGLPAVYYHSLVGSRGNRAGYTVSGIKRRINREKLDAEKVRAELHKKGSLRNLVSEAFRKLIALRREIPGFHPNAAQRVVRFRPEAFAIIRGDNEEETLSAINVSGKSITVNTGFPGRDCISDEICGSTITLFPYQYRWIQKRCYVPSDTR
ncbi:MAG: sugar phosphorylase [Spirochaetaceae bacterium]|jgi:sucrose phosphorylase|nr:sugar phosphorylase [Spirochaetaceae bacterium]